MKTLETTTTRTSKNNLKSYHVCAHNLKSAKYSLNLASKYSLDSSAAARGYKFDNLEDAIKVGESFLKSNFEGLFAHKEFMRSL